MIYNPFTLFGPNFFAGVLSIRGFKKGGTGKIYGPKQIGSTLELCPGGRHVWIQSKVGRIRKPIASL